MYAQPPISAGGVQVLAAVELGDVLVESISAEVAEILALNEAGDASSRESGSKLMKGEPCGVRYSS